MALKLTTDIEVHDIGSKTGIEVVVTRIRSPMPYFDVLPSSRAFLECVEALYKISCYSTVCTACTPL